MLETIIECKEKNWIYTLDESFFFYDSFVRKVWIYKATRPIIEITCSHKHMRLFGTVGLNGKQLFRQYIGYFYKYLSKADAL